jgi:hypothetical protein
MVSAATEFINGIALGRWAEITQMNVCPSAKNRPKYLRAKSGMAPIFFSCAAFPLAAHPDLSATSRRFRTSTREHLYHFNNIISTVILAV